PSSSCSRCGTCPAPSSGSPGRLRCRTRSSALERASAELDLVVFDDAVREHLIGHGRELLLELGARAGRRIELKLDELPDSDAFYAGEAERVERAFHRVALRIKHFTLQPHVDGRFHWAGL